MGLKGPRPPIAYNGLTSLCWSCYAARVIGRQPTALKLERQSKATTRIASRGHGATISPLGAARKFSSSSIAFQEPHPSSNNEPPKWDNAALATNVVLNPRPTSRIRSRLRQWQITHGEEGAAAAAVIADSGSSVNEAYTRPEVPASLRDETTLNENLNWKEHPDEEVYKANFQIGDLVDLASPWATSPVLAVLVAQLGTQYQFYTIHGKLIHSQPSSNGHFQCPGFMQPDELAPLKPFLPTSEVLDDFLDVFTDINATIPRNVSAPILNRMKQFSSMCDQLYRDHSEAIDNAHSLLAHETELNYLWPEDMARTLFGDSVVDDKLFHWPANYIVLSILPKKFFGIEQILRISSTSKIMLVSSKRSVRRINKVIDWARAFQEQEVLAEMGADVPEELKRLAEPIKHASILFEKAIAKSRGYRKYIPIQGVGPFEELLTVSKETKVEQLNDADQDIAYFLLTCALSNACAASTSIMSTLATIIRATGAYSPQQNGSLVTPSARQINWMLLGETGLITPWKSRYDPTRATLPMETDLNLECQDIQTELIAGEPLDAIAGLDDSFKSARRDWGDLPVYCIDSLGTLDIDDGVSIEQILEHEDECWLHVHVAHPSAFFSKDSVIGRYAIHQVESEYLPDGQQSLFPEWIANYFSVGPNGPVLTYSNRVNRNGDILESKIQPGVVHNVVFTDYHAVDKILSLSEERLPDQIFRVGQPAESTQPRQLHKLSKQHALELNQIALFAMPFYQRHARDQLVAFARENSVSVDNIQGFGVTYLDSQPKIAISKSDPTITLRVPARRLPGAFNSDALVSSCMMMAGYSAAVFCRDRNIPIFYQGTRDAYFGTDQALLRKLLASTANTELENSAIREVRRNLIRSTVATVPMQHARVDMDCYTRVTSPMRRLRDLVAGWQIDATLRAELQLARDPTDSADTTSTPFSKDELDAMLPLIMWKEAGIQARTRFQSNHFKTQFLFRAHHFGECALPTPLLARIERTTRLLNGDVMASGVLHGLLIRVTWLQGDSTGYKGDVPMPNLERGDVWEVEFVMIATFRPELALRPVRRVRKAAEPITAEEEAMGLAYLADD